MFTGICQHHYSCPHSRWNVWLYCNKVSFLFTYTTVKLNLFISKICYKRSCNFITFLTAVFSTCISLRATRPVNEMLVLNVFQYVLLPVFKVRIFESTTQFKVWTSSVQRNVIVCNYVWHAMMHQFQHIFPEIDPH